MTRSDRLKPTQQVAQVRERDAARAVGESQRRLQEEEQRLAELPAYLIVGSLALAAVGSRVLLLVAGFVGQDRAAQLMLMLAVVWIVFASALALNLSALLALLACGGFVRVLDRGRRVPASDFGLVSALALMLFFALSAATVDLGVLLSADVPALVVVAARSACKVAAMRALAAPSGIVWRKGVLTGLGLLPMSGIAMMLTQQVAAVDPQLSAQASAQG